MAKLVHAFESRFDRLKFWLGSRLAPPKRLTIIPYLGFGDRHRLFLQGRVLADYEYRPAREQDRIWRNLWSTWQFIESDEAPNVRLTASAGDIEQETVTDDEGYFRVALENTHEWPGQGDWRSVQLRLHSPLGEAASRDAASSPPIVATGRVLLPAAAAQYAVISDLDDTVVRSHVTTRLRLLRTLLMSNARTRQPFPGVASFYRALQQGLPARGPNPLFYVSSSPWNLYDLLMQFFELRGIPIAPLFLRDWGVRENELLPTRNAGHKLAIVERLMKFYSRLPFILIGDSGQEDPEIYSRIVHKFPRRVAAIYIRDVTDDLKRTADISALQKQVESAGSEMVLAGNTLTMAAHAASHGWIASSALNLIAEQSES